MKYLQRGDLGLRQAHAQANVMIQALRNECKDEFWNKLYQSVVSIAVKHHVTVYNPDNVLSITQPFNIRT